MRLSSYFDTFFYKELVSDELKATAVTQPYWTLVMDLCKLSGHTLKVVDVTQTQLNSRYSVELGLATTGIPALRVFDDSDGHNVMAHGYALKNRGRSHSCITSKHPAYLMRAMKNKRFGTPNIGRVVNFHQDLFMEKLQQAPTPALRVLDQQYDRRSQTADVTISGRLLHEALKVFFGDLNPIHVDKDTTDRLQAFYDLLNQRYQNKKTQAERAWDLFGGERLVFGNISERLLVGSIEYELNTQMRPEKVSIRTPFRMFRNLQAVQAQDPALYDEAIGRLTVHKVHLEQIQGLTFFDAEHFFPMGSHVFEDIDTFTFDPGMRTTTNIAWMIMSRGRD